ncbi:hypothetical protein ACD661_15215 [Legionella lytica]|uniref:Substrate of the Dot/Icm secretion system n=1 Tax=Legionella lytica TaxID=96232 RepID=A0ABW8DEC6_9GAMM
MSKEPDPWVKTMLELFQSIMNEIEALDNREDNLNKNQQSNNLNSSSEAPVLTSGADSIDKIEMPEIENREKDSLKSEEEAAKENDEQQHNRFGM